MLPGKVSTGGPGRRPKDVAYSPEGVTTDAVVWVTVIPGQFAAIVYCFVGKVELLKGTINAPVLFVV